MVALLPAHGPFSFVSVHMEMKKKGSIMCLSDYRCVKVSFVRKEISNHSNFRIPFGIREKRLLKGRMLNFGEPREQRRDEAKAAYTFMVHMN